MNELELLKQWIEANKEAHTIQLMLNYADGNEERIQLAREQERVGQQIDSLEQQLVEIEDKSFSQEARASMIDQFDRYISEINKAHPSLNLSRNQGFILGNELFSGIVRDINYLISDRVFGIRIPAYLKYTRDPDDSVNIPELTDFLRNEIRVLRAIEEPNYLILWQYHDQLINRIRERYIE